MDFLWSFQERTRPTQPTQPKNRLHPLATLTRGPSHATGCAFNAPNHELRCRSRLLCFLKQTRYPARENEYRYSEITMPSLLENQNTEMTSSVEAAFPCFSSLGVCRVCSVHGEGKDERGRHCSSF